MNRLTYSLSVERSDLVRLSGPFQTLPARLTIKPAPVLDASLLKGDARDLVRVATAVFTADKLCPRARQQSRGRQRELAWQREITLTLPVEDVSRWQSVAPVLTELLAFLTEDVWSLHFEAMRPLPPPQMQLFPDPLPECRVALCSQGLDSALGAALASADRRPLVLTSVVTSGPQDQAIRQLVETLKGMGVNARHVGLWVQVHGHHKLEVTQRTRGLLFLLVGAATASAVGAKVIETFENGVGALNLPLSDAQVGAQNTRAMHPRTLMLVEQVLGQALDRRVEVAAPFLLSTKGEMCLAAGDRLAALASATISCDEGNGHKANAYEHCGLCTSCLMRRAAIHAVPGFTDPTAYRGRTTHAHGRFEVESFEYQADRLAELVSWDDLVALDPVIRHVERRLLQAPSGVAHANPRESVLHLLHRHAHEVLDFLAHARPHAEPHTSRPRVERGSLDLFKATG